MGDVLEVPVPSGDRGPVEDAVLDLDRRALRFHETANEVDRLAQLVAQGWNGQAADAFDVRVAAARLALDRVSETHSQTAVSLRTYCDQWEETDRLAGVARRSIESAASTYRKDGKAAAQHLADEISRGIKSLDDPVEGIPLLGDVAGAVTSGAAKFANGFVERLLSWDPNPPEPTLLPVAPGALDLDDISNVAGAIGDAAEWGVGAVLDGVGKVIDLIGGIVDAAVSALKAVGEAFVDAVKAAVRSAGEALETLYELGRDVATAIRDVIVTTAQIVFDAVVDAVKATVDFLISLGKGIWDVVEFVLDALTTIQAGSIALLVGAIRRRFGLDERRMKNPGVADSQAFNDLFSSTTLDEIKDRQRLADWSYKTKGAPDGWERVQNYTGSEGFFAVAFRKKGTDTVVLAYRGTDSKQVKDWRDDAINASDAPTGQARDAIAVAKEMAKDPRFSGRDIEYTGHSLGGSLASIASITTGRPAKTFNAASVGGSNYLLATAAGGHGRSEKQIVNYHTAPDILTNGQNVIGLRPASGAQVTVDSTTRNPISAHGLDAFDWSKFEGPKAKVR